MRPARPIARSADARPSSIDASAGTTAAPLRRRLFSLLYESLLLVAVLWCAALPVQLLEAAIDLPHSRTLLQLYLLVVTGAYFVWQWTRGGQTLAMKTWRLRLVDARGRGVTLKQAALRYLAALVGAGLAGAGFAWAIFDRDRLFLHDRLAGTRVVVALT